VSWSEEDLIYAAGFLDGEGCFSANLDDGRGHIGVYCSNTYRPTLVWLQGLFGGSVSKAKPGNGRPLYQWSLVGLKAHEACCALAPYLREKAPQAALLISIQQLLYKSKGPRDPQDRRKPHPDVVAERHRLNSILKELKHVSW
jgi:hypothetical protein